MRAVLLLLSVAGLGVQRLAAQGPTPRNPKVFDSNADNAFKSGGGIGRDPDCYAIQYYSVEDERDGYDDANVGAEAAVRAMTNFCSLNGFHEDECEMWDCCNWQPNNQGEDGGRCYSNEKAELECRPNQHFRGHMDLTDKKNIDDKCGEGDFDCATYVSSVYPAVTLKAGKTVARVPEDFVPPPYVNVQWWCMNNAWSRWECENFGCCAWTLLVDKPEDEDDIWGCAAAPERNDDDSLNSNALVCVPPNVFTDGKTGALGHGECATNWPDRYAGPTPRPSMPPTVPPTDPPTVGQEICDRGDWYTDCDGCGTRGYKMLGKRIEVFKGDELAHQDSCGCAEACEKLRLDREYTRDGLTDGWRYDHRRERCMCMAKTRQRNASQLVKHHGERNKNDAKRKKRRISSGFLNVL